MDRNIIKNEIMMDIDLLSDDDLNDVFRFIRFLKNKENNDSDVDLLEDNSVLQSIYDGLKDKDAGNVYNWEDVK
jgi:hypothetical protein